MRNSSGFVIRHSLVIVHSSFVIWKPHHFSSSESSTPSPPSPAAPPRSPWHRPLDDAYASSSADASSAQTNPSPARNTNPQSASPNAQTDSPPKTCGNNN